LSSGPDSEVLTYFWAQVYGPSAITFSDNTSISPEISNLESGIYQCRLTISDGIYTSFSEVLVIVTDQENLEPYVSVISPEENTSFYEAKSIELSVNAMDLDGNISLIEFFEGENKIGEATEPPFSIVWTGGSIGEHQITAKAMDSGGASAVSVPVNVIITPAPPCKGGPENGDYTYRFTPDKNNPYLTFIPGAIGAGSPTCILYYGTSATVPFPGINVKPNVPYRITASEGSKVYFYYTYSFPGGERNTANAMHSYEIGSCSGSDPFLTVLLSNLSIASGSNSKATFTIDTNVECTISSDQSWITVSQETVNSYSTITLTAEANPTSVKRTANITVSGSGVTSKIIVVSQPEGTTAIEDISDDAITVYPVPAHNIIYISGLKKESEVKIYDVCGNLILTTNLNPFSTRIDLTSLSKGVYFVKLQIDHSVVVKQFVKN